MRLILWALTPFVWALCLWIVPEAGGYRLAIEPLTLALILGGLTLAGGTASGIAGAQVGGSSFSRADRGIYRRPAEGGALIDLLLGEAAFERGASGQAIAEDFLIRAAEEGGLPSSGRQLRQLIDTTRSLLLQGDTVTAQRQVDRINKTLRRPGGRKGFVGPGVAKIENGDLVFTVNDPTINALVESAGGGVSGQRTNIIRGILDLASRDPAVLGQQQQDVINRQIIEQSNRLGISPAPGIARAESEAGGLQRAAVLLQANIVPRISALSAPSTGPALNALATTRGLQGQNVGQAFDIATAIAQAEASRAAGVSNTIADTTGALMNIASLFGSSQLSSNQLQTTLGAGTPEDPFRRADSIFGIPGPRG